MIKKDGIIFEGERQMLEFDGNVIEIIKTDKGHDIKTIINKNVDVYINQECVYSEYEDEAYKYIPLNIREFVKEHGYDVGINEKGQSDVEGAYADMMLKKEFTMYFPKNKSKEIVTRFTLTDPLKDVLEMIGEYYSSNEEKEMKKVQKEVEILYNDMIDGLLELGFTLYYSHSMCDGFWGWHDLRFKGNEFNEEIFMEAANIIFNYDDEFYNIVKKNKWRH